MSSACQRETEALKLHAAPRVASGRRHMRTPADELLHVVAQDGAVAGGDGGVGEVLGLAQCSQHRARVGPHEAVVVEAEVRR